MCIAGNEPSKPFGGNADIRTDPSDSNEAWAWIGIGNHRQSWRLEEGC